MSRRYQEEFYTRRVIIQALYNNLCEFDPDFAENALKHEHMLSEIKFDRAFFKQVVNYALSKWSAFSFAEYEKKAPISRCAQAVLRAALAEFDLGLAQGKIIIDEYLELSKQFCENETGVINKILDVRMNNKDKKEDTSYSKLA